MDKSNIIWIGLDVHAESISLARFDGDGKEPITSELRNEPKVLKKVFRDLARQGEVRACYEAGPCGYEVCRLLRDLKIDCVVVAPSLIPRKPGDRVKTDTRDAVKLARLYRAQELTAVWVPTPADEAVRDLLRAREDTRNDRTAARNRLQKFLLRHGRRFCAGRGWTQKYWSWLKDQTFDDKIEKLVFDRYVDQVRYLDARIAQFDSDIAELAKSERYRDRVERLCTLRGIGTLGAMVILSELFDLQRFNHPRQLMAYLGMVPSEHSSGGKQRRGSITKTGNAHVRQVLTEAAWAYRHGPTVSARQQQALAAQPAAIAAIGRGAAHRLGKRYQRLTSRGKKPNVAIVAVARELCGFLWALDRAA